MQTLFKFLFWNESQGRLRALWRLIIFFLIVAIIGNPLILLLDTTDHAFWEHTLVNPIVAMAFLIALWICAKYIDRRPLGDFGLDQSSDSWYEMGIGFLMGALMVIIAFLLLWGMGWIKIEGRFYSIFTVPFIVAFIGQLLRYAAGSFFEELMTRSYLLRIVAEGLHGKRMGAKLALLISWIVTAIVFGVLHGFNPNATVFSVINIIGIGLLFGLPMIFTGRLGMSIGLHMGWNVFQNNIFGLPNSGKSTNTTIWETSLIGPEIWTGGAFGLEGGLIGLGSIFLGAFWVWIWLRWQIGTPQLQEDLAFPPVKN